MKFEIYDKNTEEIIDINTHPLFSSYLVVIGLDGRILLLQKEWDLYNVVDYIDTSNYEVRIKQKARSVFI